MNVFTGDCLDVLPTILPSSVDSVVTDPPYGLSFMGKDWDHGIPGWHFWQAVLCAMKPGAFLLAFGGTRTFHRLTCAIEDAGFEIRDCMMWLYGSGFPKSHNLYGDWEGWGTALKPAYEPIMVCRKPLEGTVAQNIQKWGTGAMNIDGGRITSAEPLGRLNNSTSTFNHKNTTPLVDNSKGLGRWPANVILDEESGRLLDGQSGILKSPAPYVQSTEVKGEVYKLGSLNNKAGKISAHHGDTGGASRFFYCAKASKRERNAGLEGMPKQASGAYGQFAGDGRGRQTEHQPAANTHPTVKPLSLMTYLVKLVTPLGGIVLDPFMGSGSTGVAATQNGFQFIGIEKEAPYTQIAEKRISASAVQLSIAI